MFIRSFVLSLTLFTALAASGMANAAVAGAGTVSRMVIVDQDAAGPAGSNMRAVMAFLQAPDVDVLGITVVTGDAWRDEEVAHTLRMLELIGRTDVRVYPGAVNPLWHNKTWQRTTEKLYGVKASWQGAWRDNWHAYDVVPTLPQGAPTTKAADENAAQFMVRMVRAHPGEVTIFCAGPLTNVAMAIAIEPRFAQLARELVFMGGSVSPHTELKEWRSNPTHEFNFWFDPEAASSVLRAPWKKITQTTIDASLITRVDPDFLEPVLQSDSLAASYLRTYLKRPLTDIGQIAWDELAAAVWLDPAIIKEERFLYVDVVTDHGPAYGNTVLWGEEEKPPTALTGVHVVMKPDLDRFNALMIGLFTGPTPHSTIHRK
jgi:inosine-uridine nucleoside N-ribohydrolase